MVLLCAAIGGTRLLSVDDVKEQVKLSSPDFRLGMREIIWKIAGQNVCIDQSEASNEFVHALIGVVHQAHSIWIMLLLV
jgi:hypothetical protein